ncbi:hypothetical protein FEM48_Zijuj01G0092400 [Ziziphus jujuba var. spinosa]|uniref:Uncharacterized protein n=1 Tax=Ziziphus jujuba var. spinosa TaxID=714518 RepID=A0A978W0E0_ZIZJJ|nr:hypothetical protein FEM48_Zijuj01G0092400 [Ziziphus jujuba var. spinosa]
MAATGFCCGLYVCKSWLPALLDFLFPLTSMLNLHPIDSTEGIYVQNRFLCHMELVAPNFTSPYNGLSSTAACLDRTYKCNNISQRNDSTPYNGLTAHTVISLKEG